jgi:hypothetical protein
MRCVGCQGEFEDLAGPTHEYMLSAPACWAIYGQLLAREYSDYRLMRLHRLTVDAYAIQHPGMETPAARRSVGIHLSRLYLLLERGWPIERANEVMLVINEFKDQCGWLPPPSMAGTMTVLDVAGATSVEDHEARVKAWAGSVWNAWRSHHPTVRRWCESL